MQTGRFLRLALAALLLVGLLPALTLANSDGFPIEPAPDPLDSPGKLITPPNTDASKPDPSIFERGNRIQLLVPSVYTTIQAAIDAAVDNDEIVVDAGVYPQQLIVDNKTITITGSGTATCFIQAPAVMTSPGDGIYSILMLINGANVQMQNLTVRGPATLASTETLVGGFVRSGSYAYFHDCGFGDIRSDTWASDSYGYALWVGSYFYTETGYADLVDNTFTNYQNRAIYCDGYNSQAFIEGNTMTGLGPHADIVQYGIRVNRGAYGFIDDNTVTGHDHTGPTYSAGAILMGYEAYGVISNNQLDANDMSFWLYENFTIANTISGNTINDTRNGIYMNNCTSGDLFSGNSITSVRYSGNGIMIYNTDDITAFGNIVDGDQGGETWGLGITGAPGVSSDNNTFTDNTVRNGLDYGAVVWSTATNSVFTGNIFENLDHGARVGMGGTTYESTGTVFHYNKFLSIANDGVWNDTFTPQIVDARLNWWGYNTGPYHAVDNPLGQGPPVSNYVLFDPWLLDVSSMTIDPASSGPINCSQDVTLGFDYNPGAFTPELRGYSIRVTATSEVSFTDADIVVYDDIIPGEYEVVEIVELGVNDYRIDWAVMGGGNGVDWVESFFDITFHSDNLGAHTAATVSFLAVEFRDLDNQPVSVDYSATATIDVDCLAPDAPVMDGEPLYTQGLSNTVDWSNPGGGAVLYYAEIATDAGFTALVGNSGWIGGLTHLFGGLTDTQIYYYRVRAKDALDNMSGWSNVESSTQDDTKPESEASALAQYHNTTSISVAYTSSDATSGVASVELFYSYEGAVYVSAGTGASPIAFTATLDGLYEFYTIATDGVSNVEDVPGTPPDASTTVDTAAPTAGTFMIDGGAAYTALLAVNLDSDGITDVNLPLTMRFSNDGGGTWPGGWVAFAADHPWTLTAGADGTRTVNAEYRDAAMNVLQLVDTIDYDTTAPGAVSDIAANPGHNKVEVSWVHDGSDTAVYKIYRGLWYDTTPGVSAYPEYDDVGAIVPTRPADSYAADASAEWVEAGTVAVGTLTFTDTWVDATDRGIYYYEVFVLDGASNSSLGAAANDRATNYWLGDVYFTTVPPVPYDGNVSSPDITVLAAAYGKVHGPAPYNNECDVGPTDTGQGDGIPTTDNVIGFEDLMIFALNYGNVAPMPLIQGSDIAHLSWFELEDGSWALGLTEPCANLKALQLKAQLPAGAEVTLMGGELLNQQLGPVFLRQIPGKGLDVSLAVMGQDMVISGQGLLFSVSLPAGMIPTDIELTVRDTSNNELPFELSATEVADLPTVYRFAGNYPNPFNPKTSISFDLPQAQNVKLVVFSADGRRIVTLLDEQVAAGRHNVAWSGRDEHGVSVASGVYFARIHAGPLKETHKMLLLK